MTMRISATHWGLVRPVYDNDRLTGLLPHEADPAPSPVLSELARLPYSAARIRRPAIRAGFLKGNRDGTHRGQEPFVEVSWDTALDLAADTIDRTYRNYGPSAVFGRSYGWKSTGLVNSSITLLRRLLNLCGGFVGAVNSYSTAAIATVLPYVLGVSDPQSESWESVLAHSERIIFWGCDPLITNDVDWCTTLHNAHPYFDRLKASGISTVSVNPLRTETARFLESRWLAPKPGTDVALLLALMYAILENGIDEATLTRLTDGWPVLKGYLLGTGDGIAKTPAWAESITGIPADTIRALAQDWQTHRTKLILGWGTQRRPFGEQVPWAAVALAAMLGQIGLPGGGISTNAHYSQGGCPAGVGPRPRGITEKVTPVRDFFNEWQGSRVIPVARFADCFLNPGKTIEHNGRAVTYPDIRLAVWAGGNPFAHQPETVKLSRAWQKPETTIVIDTVWTATARHADIVLPAQTVFEHNDITGIGTYTNDGLCAMQRFIDPVGEARSDYTIEQELARRLGVEAAFTEGRTEDDWIRTIYEETRAVGLVQGTILPSFETFWQQGTVFYPRRDKDRSFVPWSDFREDPANHPLKTESGRIQLASPVITSYGYADCPRHPTYLAETPTLPEDALHFLSPKHRLRLHSQLDGVLEPVGRNGREYCLLNTQDARKRGISAGDTVLLANPRGRTLCCARVTDDIMPGAVAVRHGAWCEPLELSGHLIDNHGCANFLTEDRPTSALACGNVASGGWVRVSKWDGEDRPVANRAQPRFIGH